MPRPLSVLPTLFECRRPSQERPRWHLYYLRAHRTILEWRVRRPLDNGALDDIAQETQSLCQRGCLRLTGITQKRLERLRSLPTPYAVCRSGLIAPCGQQVLDLANRLGRRATLARRGLYSSGAGRRFARLPFQGQLLRLRSFLCGHLGDQCITLGCGSVIAPARGQVEPLMRLHVILREPDAPEVQSTQGQHGLGLAGTRTRLPLGYGHVPLPSLPGALPSFVICPSGCGDQQRHYQHRCPDLTTPSHGRSHPEFRIRIIRTRCSYRIHTSCMSSIRL